MATALTTVDLSTYSREKYNVLVPTTTMQQISPFHRLRVEEVRISAEPRDGDVFKVGSTRLGDKWQDVLSLSKTGLMKLSLAAGIVWNWYDTRVLSASRDYALYQAVGAIRKPSGEWIPLKATKEIDLVVIEAELRQQSTEKAAKDNHDAAWIEQQIATNMIQWRKNKLMRAETGAMLRVIRALLAIKHQYSPQELARPFIVPCVDFAPDPNDPAVRKLMLEQGTKAMTELFGSVPAGVATAQPMPPAIDVGELRQSLGPGSPDEEPDEETPPGATGPEAEEEPADEGPAGAGASSGPDGSTGSPFEKQQEGRPDDIPPCSDCGAGISEKVYTYSLRRFGRPLCFKCQRKGQGS